ncbi:hypothetical protein NHJ13734_009630 [Beauveria thailandica]
MINHENADTQNVNNAIVNFIVTNNKSTLDALFAVTRVSSPTVINIPRKIEQLSKTYSDNKKYTRKRDEFLRIKLNIFRDKCIRLEVPETARAQALPVMLAGAAAEYYAIQLSALNLDYNSLILKLKQHFEPAMMIEGYRAKWRSLSLQKTINDNPGKPLTECVNTLVKRIQKLYHGLNREKGNSDTEKRDVLYSATLGVKAYSNALIKPDPTFNGLAAEIKQVANLHVRNKAADQQAAFVKQAAFVTNREYQTQPSYNNRRPTFSRSDRDREPDEGEELLEQMYATNLFDDNDNDQEEITGENFFTSSMTMTTNFLTSNAPAPRQVANILANAATRHALLADQQDLPGNLAAISRPGHPWWRIDAAESVAFMLSETQLRQLHRRFGHPSVKRLSRILKRANKEFNPGFIKKINEICHHCQINTKAPSRFKFTLKDNIKFNFKIIVNIFYIQRQPVLHIINSATAFQATRFLAATGQKARDVFNAIKEYIRTKEAPVKAHNTIGKVKRYHGILRRAYEILNEEAGTDMTSKQKLQAAVKAINNTARPNGLVPTLLVFGAYPRLTNNSPPNPSVTRQAKAIRKAMNKVRKELAKRQVQDALRMRNGPVTSHLQDLPLQSEVRVFREKGGWKGPYKLLAVNSETCTLDMPRGPANFRTTVIQPYFRSGEGTIPAKVAMIRSQSSSTSEASEEEEGEEEPAPRQSTRPNRGRHSRREEQENKSNFTEALTTAPIDANNPGVNAEASECLPAKALSDDAKASECFLAEALFDEAFFNETLFEGIIEDEGFLNEAFFDNALFNKVFLTTKEQLDLALAIELRKKGIITTPGEPFKASDRVKVNNLHNKDVFRFKQYDGEKHGSYRLFKARIKGQANRLRLPGTKQEYVEQRARGAYLSSVCQPEAAYNLSVAAQQKEPDNDDFKRLRQRLQ